MEKLLKNLEYLIPLFIAMPSWVKIVSVIWFAFSVVWIIFILSLNYTKNKEKALEEETHKFAVVETLINRQIEDYDLASKSIFEQFPKKVNQINEDFNVKGAFHSGVRRKKLKDTVNVYKEKIDAEYRKLIRVIEDILIEKLKQKDINTIPELKDEAKKIEELHTYYEKQKIEFENLFKKQKF